jgi:hypothetical protein
MNFVQVTDRLPQAKETVLVRGWGEGKKHYIYGFACIEPLRSGGWRWWSHDHGEELWFEPIAWTELEQPNAAVEPPA